MSSQYKVKVGERVVEVEGLAGLVRLVQAGELKPEDPVWVPTTSQWHYAKSIRQLREHFGGDRNDPRQSPEPETEPEPKPEPAQAQAEIVPFRRGPWTADGKGIEVPIFAYDLEAEAPPVWPILRALFMLGGGLFALLLVYVYLHGYNVYLARTLEKLDAEILPDSGYAPERGHARAVSPASTDAATSAPAAADASTPVPTVAPPAAPLFDEAAARERVVSASVTRVARPGDLGDALRADLLRLAVPLHAAGCDVPRDAKTPRFVCTLDYAAADADAPMRARHRFMILAMTGRRISELGMKVESVRFRAVTGQGKSARTVETRISGETATGLWSGSASAAALDEEKKR